MNPKVDFFFNKAGQWKEEFNALRTIVLSCGLTEELKWGHPCYTLDKKNIVLIHGFKEYCALLFFKGALMKDSKEILIQQTENVQAGRHIRFNKLSEITKMKSTIKAYVKDAIEIEKAGLKIVHKKTAEYPVPEELKNKFADDSAFKAAFKALTPGRQRGYLLYFAQAKQSKTRESRIEKSIPDIMKGKGWNDR